MVVDDESEYEARGASQAFAGLEKREVERFVKKVEELDSTTTRERFSQRVREWRENVRRGG